MKPAIILLLTIFRLTTFGQQYAVSDIPDSLKKECNAVKRFEELRVTIKSESKAVVTHKWAITILNKEAERYSFYTGSYDKFRGSPTVSGTLYNSAGKEIKSLKRRDVVDFAPDDHISLVSDSRMKAFSFDEKNYPYTVAFEEEQTRNGIFFLPGWAPVETEHMSVQKSSFIVETPPGYNLRYRLHCTTEPKITNGGTSYSWELSNYKGIQPEVFMPALSTITPSVYIAPTNFEIGGYSGNMSTWKDLGKFIYELNKGRDELPDNVKQDIHKLTDNLVERSEKIKVLYNYLQERTHYVLITLGMGGWQPFEASNVAKNGYGDCKALSNFMVAIFKEAKLPANYVIIKSGDNAGKLWTDFPSPYFDHAIMCLPSPTDTTWLECTSQTVSPGFMGSFTGDRDCLMITDSGGVIVHTPVYTASDNMQRRVIRATMDALGTITADISATYTGIEQEIAHALIHQLSKEQKEKYLNKVLDIPTYSVDKYDYSEIKNKIPAIHESLSITAIDYGNVTGKRIFIHPNLLSKNTIRIAEEKERKLPIEFRYPFTQIDSIFIVIPQGYTAESLPQKVTIQNKFGFYDITFSFSNNIITMTRVYKREKGSYGAEDFKELAAFYEQIYSTDHSKMVLVKKD